MADNEKYHFDLNDQALDSDLLEELNRLKEERRRAAAKRAATQNQTPVIEAVSSPEDIDDEPEEEDGDETMPAPSARTASDFVPVAEKPAYSEKSAAQPEKEKDNASSDDASAVASRLAERRARIAALRQRSVSNGADNATASAEAEAALIVDRANRKADKIVTDAETEADEILRAAMDEADDIKSENEEYMKRLRKIEKKILDNLHNSIEDFQAIVSGMVLEQENITAELHDAEAEFETGTVKTTDGK